MNFLEAVGENLREIEPRYTEILFSVAVHARVLQHGISSGAFRVPSVVAHEEILLWSLHGQAFIAADEQIGT